MEFKFTDAEKEEINKATYYAMGDTLDRLYPLFEKVVGERLRALQSDLIIANTALEMHHEKFKW